MIAETEYRSEVEVITAPFKGLALGIFLITVGMSIDLGALLEQLAGNCSALWPACCWSRRWSPACCCAWSEPRPGVAAETGLLMACPSETTLIVLGAAGAAGILSGDTVAFWSAATAIGLTITPLLASLGRLAARRVDRAAARQRAP